MKAFAPAHQPRPGTLRVAARSGHRVSAVRVDISSAETAATAAPSAEGGSKQAEAESSGRSPLHHLVKGFAFFPSWAPGPQVGAQEVLQEANRQEEAVQQCSAPADITPFLEHVSLAEIRNIRRLSNLCGLSYKPHLVTERGMRLRHRLELVTTSWSYRECSEGPRTAADAVAQGDGMAVGFEDATATYATMDSIDDEALGLTEPLGVASATPLGIASASPLVAILQPATVASKLAEAAAAASAAAAAVADLVRLSKLAGSSSSTAADSGGGGGNGSSDGSRHIDGATSSMSGGGPYGQYSLASGDDLQAALEQMGLNDGAFSFSSTSDVAPPLQQTSGPSSSGSTGAAGAEEAASVVQLTSALKESSAALTASANAAAAASSAAAAIPSNPCYVAQPSSSAPALCPSEWFVCDDSSSYTRTFVIQGSDSVEHWRLNLTFDPAPFEDPGTGVTVHRGCYEAALELYDRFLPLIYDHLDSSPFAKIAFTGHSIGGSLAMLLTLLYKKRGVLQANSIAPCYMFGAPSVFCGTQHASNDWNNVAYDQDLSPVDPGASHLLPSLGLDVSVVRNVMMHRDIVPRAFTCDYPDIISRILKGWGPAFRLHNGLQGDGHKHLYSFVGTLLVLQPARNHAFVLNDPDHPLLPPGPGLYRLRAPRQARKHDSSSSSPQLCGCGTAASPSYANGATASVQRAALAPGTNGRAVNGMVKQQPPGARVPASTAEAVLAIMDNPHPLQTLMDPAVYKEGQIVRYHHPDNLTQALGKLIHVAQASGKEKPDVVNFV